MEIKGDIWCLFEQSGTYRNAFRVLGYNAWDVDCSNMYNCTDFMRDIFKEISRAFYGRHSLFDEMTKEDLLMAFFPCIYFCENNELFFTAKSRNYKNMERSDVLHSIIRRAESREYYYKLLLMLCTLCEERGLRLIVENPYSVHHFLHNNFPWEPAIIDRNRRVRGDYFRKPTMYYFINCTPTQGCSVIAPAKLLTVQGSRSSSVAGSCSLPRSICSPEYARAFINDFIFGNPPIGDNILTFEN